MIKNALPNQCIGLIPAAGKGTRLGLPFPKELLPILSEENYKPVAQCSLEYILAADVKHIVFVINETKNALIGYFGGGDQFNCNISYVVQETLQNNINSKSPGLAHALDSAYHLTKEKFVFFSMPDTIISPFNVFSQAKQQTPENADIVLCLFPTSTPEKYGMVDYDAEFNVVKIIDKPQVTNLSYMWGCIIWSPKFTHYLHEAVSNKGQGDFAEILNNAISFGFNTYGFEVKDGKYFDIGTYDEINDVYIHFQK